MKDVTSFQLIRTGVVIVLAGMLTVGVVGPVRPARAAQMRRSFSPPFRVKMGQTITVSVANTDNQPAGVQVHVLQLNDFSPLDSSGPFTLMPRTGNSWASQTLPAWDGILLAIDILSPRDANSGQIQACMQVHDDMGRSMFNDCTGPWGL